MMSPGLRIVLAMLLATTACTTACSSDPPLRLSGESCELNSDCSTPYVCRLSKCRMECATSRDCSAGLNCLLDENHLGACQLPVETHCVLASDCAAGLVCNNASCTNVCETDVDCAAGAQCKTEAPNTAAACVDTATVSCITNSDCADSRMPDLACARDGQCRAECVIRESCGDNRGCRNTDCFFEELCEDIDGDGAGRCVDDNTSSLVRGIRTFAVGDEHVVAADSDSPGLFGWGMNDAAQLSDLATGSILTPAHFGTPLLHVEHVAAGARNTCVLAGTDGTDVYCWGANERGQVGAGGTVDETSLPTPTLVSFGGATVDALSIGASHACALATSTGDAFCWGDNSLGQCGADPVTALFVSPSPIGLANVTSIETGDSHTCAATSAGEVYCWGDNASGNIGSDFSTPYVVAPTLVPLPLSDGTAPIVLSASESHTCAVINERLYCWGSDDFGQLGTGTARPDRHGPAEATAFPSEIRFKSVAVGDSFTCAITTSDDVYCFGHNDMGQLGSDDHVDSTAPVSTMSGADILAAGKQFACARGITNLGIYCWGSDEHGQLGNSMSGVGLSIAHPILVSL